MVSLCSMSKNIEGALYNRPSRVYRDLEAHVPLGDLGLRSNLIEQFVEMVESKPRQACAQGGISPSTVISAGCAAIELGLNACGFPERSEPPTPEKDGDILDPYLNRAHDLFSMIVDRAERDPAIWQDHGLYSALLYRQTLPFVYAQPPEQLAAARTAYDAMCLECMGAILETARQDTVEDPAKRLLGKLLTAHLLKDEKDILTLLPLSRQLNPPGRNSRRWHVNVWQFQTSSDFHLARRPNLRLKITSNQARATWSDRFVTPMTLRDLGFLDWTDNDYQIVLDHHRAARTNTADQPPIHPFTATPAKPVLAELAAQRKTVQFVRAHLEAAKRARQQS